jgi:hypothetical protein
MSEPISRRSFLRGLALGGAVIAGELWIPGAKVISIPKRPLTEDNLEAELKYVYRTYGTSIAYTRDPLSAEEYERMVNLYSDNLARSIQSLKINVAARVYSREFGNG